MTLRLLADASAQTTVSGTITNVATSIAAVSTANFPAPVAGQQSSLIILDSGNVAFSASNPLATNFEYCTYTTNTVGTNTISGITRGVAGTTAKSYSAGATIAVPWLAEDVVASAPWKYDEQVLGGTTATVRIPASGSIPASYLGINYRHLFIQIIARGDTAAVGTDIAMQFNGDTATNYNTMTIAMTNNAVSGTNNQALASILTLTMPANTAPVNKAGIGIIEVPFFSQATFHKSAEARSGSIQGSGLSQQNIVLRSGDWGNAAAITSILLFPAAGNFVTGSIFTTYLVP